MDLRVKRDHVPYGIWERQGFLQTTEGNVVHYGFIEKFIEKLGERFNIREIAFDRWGAVQMVQNLENMGFTVVPMGQGFASMSPPTKELTKKFGKGFSRSNINCMINFYKGYGTVQTLSGQLSWSHYCELLSISDKDKRHFYEIECSKSQWSVRELRRQIESSLFERLLLSQGDINKEKVLELALKGNELAKPKDLVKDPHVFEFLGLPENKPMMESDLEEALVRQIEKFLLELGKGFMFVGTQQRVTFGNVHYYVDMVFYNKILKSYVLIELKTIKLMPEAVGQLNMYLNYYAAEINDEGDNPPIGLILCTDKGNVDMQYALGGLSNNIFASKYITYMPNKEELISQVEAVLAKNNR